MNSQQQKLIHNHSKRIARSREKRRLILRFLRQNIWSTQIILQQVVNVESRQAIHKTLKNLEKEGLIRNEIFNVLGGKLTVWGITNYGQAEAFDYETEDLISTVFEPKRISETSIKHSLDLQSLMVIAQNRGWKSWQNGDRLSIHKSQKRPDAIATSLAGRVVAIECERTFKSHKRYEQILLQYLILIKSGDINHVVWVSPTSEMALKLRKIICSIKTLRVNGQKLLVEPRHHQSLFFCSYDDWPNYA